MMCREQDPEVYDRFCEVSRQCAARDIMQGTILHLILYCDLTVREDREEMGEFLARFEKPDWSRLGFAKVEATP